MAASAAACAKTSLRCLFGTPCMYHQLDFFGGMHLEDCSFRTAEAHLVELCSGCICRILHADLIEVLVSRLA